MVDLVLEDPGMPAVPDLVVPFSRRIEVAHPDRRRPLDQAPVAFHAQAPLEKGTGFRSDPIQTGIDEHVRLDRSPFEFDHAIGRHAAGGLSGILDQNHSQRDPDLRGGDTHSGRLSQRGTQRCDQFGHGIGAELGRRNRLCRASKDGVTRLHDGHEPTSQRGAPTTPLGLAAYSAQRP